MAYPSLEQYNLALQSPQLVLQDQELKHGRLKINGLGLPLALCGGFALTYTVDVGAKTFALRCFHKESRELERRYQAISARLKQLASPYFLPFEFIPNGIRIQGAIYPIVKMAWAQGATLAEFLEREHRNIEALQRLRQALTKLASFLEQHQIAHGDIQPENVMVSASGSAVQLIDYDGMFVAALRGSNATELGQINFQHPKRSANDFNEKLDRFSFLTLDVALQALIASPPLWTSSRSEPSAVVFRRNDLADPGAAAVFQDVIKLPGSKTPAENLARVAAGSIADIPSLSDFIQNKGIAPSTISFRPRTTHTTVGYQGAYPVCDATKYNQVLAQVGNRIELIGQIHSVRHAWGVNKKPYVFVNFSDWRGQAVKLAIWSDGMNAISPTLPDEAWVGRWLSITGLVDPPYSRKAKNVSYTHLSITINARSQIQQLTEKEARARLIVPPLAPASSTPPSSNNAKILQSLGRKSSSTRPSRPSAAPSVQPLSNNQQLLDKMKAQVPPPSRSTTPSPPARPAPKQQQPTNSNMAWGRWAVVIVAGLILLRACAG